MNARKYLIAFTIAVLITAAEFAGLSLLAGRAGRSTRQAFVIPETAIPVLPTITVRPTHEEVRAALASVDLASAAHPDYSMPFYSFAVKPAAANKG